MSFAQAVTPQPAVLVKDPETGISLVKVVRHFDFIRFTSIFATNWRRRIDGDELTAMN